MAYLNDIESVYAVPEPGRNIRFFESNTIR